MANGITYLSNSYKYYETSDLPVLLYIKTKCRYAIGHCKEIITE